MWWAHAAQARHHSSICTPRESFLRMCSLRRPLRTARLWSICRRTTKRSASKSSTSRAKLTWCLSTVCITVMHMRQLSSTMWLLPSHLKMLNNGSLSSKRVVQLRLSFWWLATKWKPHKTRETWIWTMPSNWRGEKTWSTVRKCQPRLKKALTVCSTNLPICATKKKIISTLLRSVVPSNLTEKPQLAASSQKRKTAAADKFFYVFY